MYIYYIKSTTCFAPIFIGHLQVDNSKLLVNSHTRFFILGLGGAEISHAVYVGWCRYMSSVIYYSKLTYLDPWHHLIVLEV